MAQPSASPKVALVTGAADRIGAAIALRLATAGYAVAIHHRGSAAEARQTAAKIEAVGGRAAVLQADLTNRTERGQLVASAAKSLGSLSVLVNCASTFQPDAITDLDEKLWDAHFAIHAEAPVFLARDFAAQLPLGIVGDIINIIDERVLHLSPAYFSYTLSKSVLWTATQTLAQSLAPRIKVNAIGPGPTLKHSRQSQAEFQRSVDALPLQHGPTPEEIAETVMVFINSPSITGQMLAVDGGEHLGFPPDRAPTPRQ